MMIDTYCRGSVWWIDLGKYQKFNDDHIICKKRLCVVVSNQMNNMNSPCVNIVPFSTKPDSLPIHPKIIIQGIENYPLVEQIRTVHKKELQSYIGVLTPYDMKIINNALKLQLELDPEVGKVKEHSLEEQLETLLEVLDKITTAKSNEFEKTVQSNVKLSNKLSEATKKVNDKYKGMTQVEKFNAKYTNQSSKKQVKEKHVWTEELKCNLIDDYESTSSKEEREKLLDKYQLKDMKQLHQYIYKFRKEFRIANE